MKRIINEPTAAALAYGLDKKAAEAAAEAAEDDDEDAVSAVAGKGKKGKGKGGKKESNLVLIFDLGGGTFDVSLLAIEGGIFEVKATAGDTHLGGEDFDMKIMDYALGEWKKKNKGALAKLAAEGKPSEPADDKRAMRRLRTTCERSKRMLSTASTTTVELESFFDGIDMNVVLTRAKFEELNSAPFLRCIDTVKRVLVDAKVTPADVGDVVLVGGSTRIPKVQELLSAYFGGKDLCKSINPDEAVAYGAAVQGAILGGARSSQTQSLLLVDVTPLSLGIETTGGVMSTIIKRNTPIPCVKTKQYTTDADYQDAVDVSIYEGERATTDGNDLLGEFTIRGIEHAKRGIPQVEVTFELDANGILNVTAVDSKTKAKAHISISNNRGRRSADEIERMVAEAERLAKDDAKRLELIEARNELESLMYTAKDVARAHEDAKLIGMLAELQRWLDESVTSATAVRDIKEKTELLHVVLGGSR